MDPKLLPISKGDPTYFLNRSNDFLESAAEKSNICFTLCLNERFMVTFPSLFSSKPVFLVHVLPNISNS